MKSLGSKLLISAAVVLVTTNISFRLASSVAKHVNEQKAEVEASGWLEEARNKTNPNMTVDDVVDWLKEHGAKEIGFNGTRWHNDELIERHGVKGTRRLSQKGLWSEPKTATLLFHFDENGHCQGVDLETHNF
jgi:hypothetical protein